MNTGSTPGDGKTSPFGDGRGGSAGGNVSGNDFGTNPRGNPSGPKSIPDVMAVQRQQPKAKPDVNTQDAASGGLLPLDGMTPPASRTTGVGSIGNNQKPFKLNG